MDLFSRRNIESVNAQFTVQPRDKVKLLAWWHYLGLENGNNVNMTPFNAANLPIDSELGHELDLHERLRGCPRGAGKMLR